MAMRIYTCTPRDFTGGEAFFSRDSGLLCRGLSLIGVESRAVMLGLPMAGDRAEVLRASLTDLESSEWWRSQSLDGVVLYSWGRPKFRKVAAAIHLAGIRLILNQDNGGVVSPLNGLVNWLRQQWHQTGQGKGCAAWCRLAYRVVRGMTYGMVLTDPLRRMHLLHGDRIACVSPLAAEHCRKLCRIYGGEKMEAKVTLLPHPVEGRFHHSGEKKSERLVCVGRWSDETQKRTQLMMAVLERLLAVETVAAEIVGAATPSLESWYVGLPVELQKRVNLRGRIGREELAGLFAGAQIFYSPSAYESFGIAAGEALCSGCSVVSARLVSMGSFEWFTENGCGTLAADDHVEGHVAALRKELAMWRGELRDPAVISKYWIERLHDKAIAKRVLFLLEEKADMKRDEYSL